MPGVRRMRVFADLIDAFQHAEGPPSDRLWPFMAWALKGAFPAIWMALVVSVEYRIFVCEFFAYVQEDLPFTG